MCAHPGDIIMGMGVEGVWMGWGEGAWRKEGGCWKDLRLRTCGGGGMEGGMEGGGGMEVARGRVDRGCGRLMCAMFET